MLYLTKREVDYLPIARLYSLSRLLFRKKVVSNAFNSVGSGLSLLLSHSCSSNSQPVFSFHIKIKPELNLSNSDTKRSGNSYSASGTSTTR